MADSKSFSVAAIFSDHMVLQRNKYTALFGEAEDGALIHAELFNAKGQLLCKNTSVAEGGRWLLKLEPQSAQTGCSLEVSCGAASSGESRDPAGSGNCKSFTDIVFGEVWLAGGQSNMEFELQNCTEGPAELADDAAGKNVRFYYTNKIGWKDQHFYEAEKQTAWQTWESPSKGAWSAVGYFFAKKLAADLGCVVGVIGCNWGGTSASAWMRKEYLEADRDTNTYLTEYEEATRGKSIDQQCKEYDDYEVENAKWQEQYSRLWEKDHGISWEAAEKILGKNPWPGPKSCKNPYRPCGLYDCMISRILPYTLKGVLWYQGESDDHKPASYYKLFRAMVDNWRSDWNDNLLPFVCVQLPVHRYEADPDYKHWCLVREQQAKAAATINNVWLTSAFDLGQYSDIHPRAKKVLAERMEALAQAKVYQLLPSLDACAPEFESCLPVYDEAGSGSIVLTFANAPLGFEVRTDETRLEEYKKMEERQGNTVSPDFTGFEVCGSDGVWYPAEFALGGTEGKLNTIVLCSKKVSRPVAARYGWYNYGPVTIYGKNGLPLCPFRTNAETAGSEKSDHAKIQQIMTV